MPTRITLFSAGAVLALGLSGCAAAGSVTSVSAQDLQMALSEKLLRNGTPPEAVNCDKDLAGKVGSTTRCQVEFTDSNQVDAILTTTDTANGKVGWEITNPDMSKDQLARRLAAQSAAQTVTCDSGLDGYVGDWTQCQVTVDGVTLNGSVEVGQVKGLTMDLKLDQELPQAAAEDLLLTRVTPDFGRRPDRAACEGSLPAAVGNTVKCVVAVDDTQYDYLLTVAGTPTGPIEFQYSIPEEPAPLPLDAVASEVNAG